MQGVSIGNIFYFASQLKNDIMLGCIGDVSDNKHCGMHVCSHLNVWPDLKFSKDQWYLTENRQPIINFTGYLSNRNARN